MFTDSCFFYSDQLDGSCGALDALLLEHLPRKDFTVGYVPSESNEKPRFFDRVAERYAFLGARSVLALDWERVDDRATVQRTLACDVLHLGSGDVCAFLTLVQRSGLAPALKNQVRRGGVLVGVSAGAMIMGRSIALERHFPQGAPPPKNLRGLGFSAFDFFPHFDGDRRTERVLLEASRSMAWPIVACHDSEGVALIGGRTHFLGDPAVFDRGRKRAWTDAFPDAHRLTDD